MTLPPPPPRRHPDHHVHSESSSSTPTTPTPTTPTVNDDSKEHQEQECEQTPPFEEAQSDPSTPEMAQGDKSVALSPSVSALPPPPRRTLVVNPSSPTSPSSSSFTPVTSHAPPPRRTVPAPASSSSTSGGKIGTSSATTEKESWSQWSKRKTKGWGGTAMEKGIGWSDSLGSRVNAVSAKMGGERFWPTTGDFPEEMDKAARILRAFTVDGIETKVEEKDAKTGKKKQRRVLKKIPASVIREAKGLAIFTSMRSGIAPLGGAGGAGIVVAKLPDGTWSAPSSMSPNNLSAGAILGADIYDAVLVIRTQAALDSFATHKATLGTELGVAAGPWGSGAALEMGRERSPVLSYVKSRGFFVGIEVVGQVFVERFDENAKMYYWPGIKAGDILSGKVAVPLEAANLQAALYEAESGIAQTLNGGPEDADLEPPLAAELAALEVEDGEVIHLPPTPEEMSVEEAAEIREMNRRLKEEELERRRRQREEEEWEKRQKWIEERERKEALGEVPSTGSIVPSEGKGVEAEAFGDAKS